MATMGGVQNRLLKVSDQARSSPGAGGGTSSGGGGGASEGSEGGSGGSMLCSG